MEKLDLRPEGEAVGPLLPFNWGCKYVKSLGTREGWQQCEGCERRFHYFELLSSCEYGQLCEECMEEERGTSHPMGSYSACECGEEDYEEGDFSD